MDCYALLWPLLWDEGILCFGVAPKRGRPKAQIDRSHPSAGVHYANSSGHAEAWQSLTPSVVKDSQPSAWPFEVALRILIFRCCPLNC